MNPQHLSGAVNPQHLSGAVNPQHLSGAVNPQHHVVCADIGSTFTKVAVVDLQHGQLVATAEHPTTANTDVWHGLQAAVADTGAATTPWYVCSSAGGGLRLAVVGHQELVTAEAGRQVATSAGARVVHVNTGQLDSPAIATLTAQRAEVVLLVGGTDGGEADTLWHNAAQLAAAQWHTPVVVAGNAAVCQQVTEMLIAAGVPAVATANVLPAIGQVAAGPARAAIRQVFLQHVIGGKQLSRQPQLMQVMQTATPDAVLSAVELLADHGHGDMLVVDVGGATTDVYSALSVDAQPEQERPVPAAGLLGRVRSVEGDLGVRVGAPGVVQAAKGERLLNDERAAGLTEAAHQRAEAPDTLPGSQLAHTHDRQLAGLAATVALRRHARGATAGTGRDLQAVTLVVGCGGVLRHQPADRAVALLGEALSDYAGGWALPRSPQIVIDQHYVLAAVGMLANRHPEAALQLARRQLQLGRLGV